MGAATLLKKPVTRETRMTIRDRSERRSLMVTLLPGDVIEIRPKGTRARFSVDIETVFELAMKLEARRLAAEKAKTKAAKRPGR